MAEHNDPPQEPTLPSKRMSDPDLQDLPSKIPKLDLKETLPTANDNFLQNDDEDDDDNDDDEEEQEDNRKGKGIMRDDKGKGKMIVEEEDDDDDDSDEDSASDDDGSDFSNDSLTEVDLNNILPSRTRGRTVSSGVHIAGDSGNAAAAVAAGIDDEDSDSDDSDAWIPAEVSEGLGGNGNGLVLLLTMRKKCFFRFFFELNAVWKI